MIDNLMKEGSMRCLDDKDIDGNDYNISFYGSDISTDHRRLELVYETCLSKGHKLRGNRASKGNCELKKGMNDTEKNEAKDELFEKMGISEFIFVYNTQHFNSSAFEKESITNLSFAHSTLFKVSDGPQWQNHLF